MVVEVVAHSGTEAVHHSRVQSPVANGPSPCSHAIVAPVVAERIYSAPRAYVARCEGFLHKGVCAPVLVEAIVQHSRQSGNSIVAAVPQRIAQIAANSKRGFWRQLGDVHQVDILCEGCSADGTTAEASTHRGSEVDVQPLVKLPGGKAVAQGIERIFRHIVVFGRCFSRFVYLHGQAVQLCEAVCIVSEEACLLLVALVAGQFARHSLLLFGGFSRAVQLRRLYRHHLRGHRCRVGHLRMKPQRPYQCHQTCDNSLHIITFWFI